MREVRRGDDHRIDIRIVRDVLILRRDLRDPPVLDPLLEQLFVGVTDRDQLGPLVDPDAGDVVVIRDGTGSDDGVANGMGGVVRGERLEVRGW